MSGRGRGGWWGGSGRGWRGRGGGGGWRGGGRGGSGGVVRVESSSSVSSLEGSPESVEDYSPVLSPSSCPYTEWRRYLPTTLYTDDCPELSHITAARNYITSQEDLLDRDLLEETKHFYLDVTALLEDDQLRLEWPNLEEMVKTQTEVVCGLFGLAMHHLLTASDTSPATVPLVRARLENYDNLVALSNLRSNYFQRLVVVQGNVVKVGPLTVLNTWLAWLCVACRQEVVIRQPGGKFQAPTRCPHGCRGQKNFIPLRQSRSTITVNRQVVRLQEVLEGEGGRVPRTVECELLEDLVDTCIPGDHVRITGVLKTSDAKNKKQSRKNQSQFLLFISAVGVSNDRTPYDHGSVGDLVHFTYNDHALIQDIHSYGPEIFKLLVNSLCPAVFGYNMVKAGLLLGMFGGTARTDRVVPERAAPHILVVGDPGLGKSQLLTAVSNISPRGIFVSGNTSTAVGLTMAMAREIRSDLSLEAGSLVLADQGVCCIDEFDKMFSHHSALLEAMEQQSISICKSGVICTVPARVSVLAAANPVKGHYNKAKTVAENLKMSSAILSRFDLIFILLDRADQRQDSLMADHVLAQYASPSSLDLSQFPAAGERNQSETLLKRISLGPRERNDPVPAECLKKYIAYARKYVHPSLDEGAANALRTFYVELRRKHQTGNCIPITTRQLVALKRLTEARAKLELREVAVEQDALDVIEMMKASMVDTFADDLGVVDFNRAGVGSGALSDRAAAKRFLPILQQAASDQGKRVFSVDEMKRLAAVGKITLKGNFNDFLETLNTQGFLLKKSGKLYQLLT